MNVATQKREKRTRNGTRETFPRQERGFTLPEADIVETKDAYVVTAEMPGVNKDGLEITLESNVLTIVGRRKADAAGNLLFRESRPHDFRRVFELAPSVDVGKIQARLENGVLTLELPKAERVKPKRIAITA